MDNTDVIIYGLLASFGGVVAVMFWQFYRGQKKLAGARKAVIEETKKRWRAERRAAALQGEKGLPDEKNIQEQVKYLNNLLDDLK